MERSPAVTPLLRLRPFAWKVIGWYLPAVAFALAAFLFVHEFTGDGGHQPPPTTVDPAHAGRLAANIAFFENRVHDAPDYLSYNRLTGLYLQRLRETGDTADLRRAETSALASLARVPGDYSGLVLLAQVRIAQHDFAAAEPLARQALELRPALPDAHAVLGDALMALGRYDEAGDAYAVALDRAPGAATFAREATFAEVRGNVALAEQYWKAAIDADRSDAPESSAWARVQLATLYFNSGRLDAARTQLDTALRVYPGYFLAQAGLATVAAAKGDDARAIALYTAANERVPQPANIAALADVYAHAGKPREAAAQAELLHAIGQLLEANGVRNELTLILFDLDHGGDIPATLEHARVAYEDRPSLEAADVYAWALYRAGRFDEARAKAEEALRLGIRDPRYLFHAGAIAFAQGDFVAARGWLQQVRDLNPTFSVLHAPEAADLLTRAKERAR